MTLPRSPEKSSGVVGDGRQVMSMRVHQALRQEILRGDLEPGQRLIARDLSARFGVSDIPVREALWVLAREGLVDMQAYSGARVAALSREDVLEVLVVRANLEGLATELAAQRVDPEDLAALEHVLSQMQAVVESPSPDPLEYARLNRAFHGAIFDRCGNGKLVHAIQLLWEGHSQLQMVFRLKPDRLRHSMREHRAIFEALASGDAQRAGQLAAQHKKLQQEDLLLVLKADESARDAGDPQPAPPARRSRSREAHEPAGGSPCS